MLPFASCAWAWRFLQWIWVLARVSALGSQTITDPIRHGMAEHDPFNWARVSKNSGALPRRCIRALQDLQDQADLAKRLFLFVCALQLLLPRLGTCRTHHRVFGRQSEFLDVYAANIGRSSCCCICELFLGDQKQL